MRPKTVMILLAFFLNLGLLLASSTSSAKGNQERSNNSIFPCCKKNSAGRPYCCENCCYFRWDCLEDEHCAPGFDEMGEMGAQP